MIWKLGQTQILPEKDFYDCEIETSETWETRRMADQFPLRTVQYRPSLLPSPPPDLPLTEGRPSLLHHHHHPPHIHLN